MTDTPPPDPDDTITIGHVQAVSQNARTTWFAQLGVLAFTVVTLMSFSDRDFFVGGATIKLPVIAIDVSPLLYLLFGPVLALAVHIYLHVHLMKLWAALPRLVARARIRPKGRLAERIFPWLIADFALNRSDSGLVEKNRLSGLADIATLLFAWVATPATLGWFWWRAMPYHDWRLTLFHGALMLVAGYVSVVSFR